MTTTAKERPILFNGEMVRAILDGRKTVTRRPVKPQPWSFHVERARVDDEGFIVWSAGGDHSARGGKPCPYGVPGDRLWVRETWGMSYVQHLPDGRSHTCGGTWGTPSAPEDVPCVVYRSDGDMPTPPAGRETARWSPSIHMPRWASRITLEVVDVSIERVQEITYDEMLDEGIIPRTGGVETTYPFAKRWDALYDDGPYGWVSNPWVWVVSFRRVES